MWQMHDKVVTTGLFGRCYNLFIFENVSFGYQEKEVLHGISVILSRNSLTALVGPSGSGKSTVMKLCARFYDPTKGRILFGGVPIREIEPEKLMSRISMVFQDV